MDPDRSQIADQYAARPYDNCFGKTRHVAFDR